MIDGVTIVIMTIFDEPVGAEKRSRLLVKTCENSLLLCVCVKCFRLAIRKMSGEVSIEPFVSCVYFGMSCHVPCVYVCASGYIVSTAFGLGGVDCYC